MTVAKDDSLVLEWRGVLFIGGLASLIYGCATPTQLILDAEVDRLCAENAGRPEVYAVVRVRPSDPPIVIGESSRGEAAYYFANRYTYLHGNSDPGGTAVLRSSLGIYRAADKKLLGEVHTYGRRGGDVLGPLGMHPSAHTCHLPPDAIRVLRDSIFQQSETKE